jgi:hypothetical protein
MADVQIESDPLFQLLTDALRAGPQSAEWSQAVAQVRESGWAETDEYKLLLQAREDLESGKEYKAIRAGAGFTRNLFGKIDEEKEAAKAKGLPTANLLAIGAGVVLLGVVVVVAVLMSRGGKGNESETLPSVFVSPVFSTNFAPPDRSMTISSATPADLSDGLRPGPATGEPGSFARTEAVAAQPERGRFEIEAELQLPAGGKGAALTQVFVQPANGAATASFGELSWVAQGTEQRVRLGEQTLKTGALPADGTVTVQIVVGNTVAAVYSNKQLLWTGEHKLPSGPKLPGVRFLRPAGDAGPVPVVKVVRVRNDAKTTRD